MSWGLLISRVYLIPCWKAFLEIPGGPCETIQMGPRDHLGVPQDLLLHGSCSGQADLPLPSPTRRRGARAHFFRLFQ